MEVNTSVLLTAIAALRACNKHVQRCVTGQPLDELDVSILAFAGAAKGSLKPSHAAAELEVAFPSITRHVRSLQDRELITIAPDEDDGRSYVITLTKAGDTALCEYRDNLVKRIGPAVAEWEPDELVTFATQLTRLADGMTTTHADAPTARTPLWPTE